MAAGRFLKRDGAHDGSKDKPHPIDALTGPWGLANRGPGPATAPGARPISVPQRITGNRK